jgi:uncharacterized OsmC-like protein
VTARTCGNPTVGRDIEKVYLVRNGGPLPMARINNVDVERLRGFEEQIRHEPAAARRTQVIEGKWLPGEGGAQFRSVIAFEGGKATLDTDNPTFMGGGGTLPGPMHYCFFGLASCYTGVFASTASLLGIPLRNLSVRVEADVNFSKVYGISEDPIMEEIRVVLTVESDAPEERIREAEELALQRCPVVFTLRNRVPLTPSLEIRKETAAGGEAA